MGCVIMAITAVCWFGEEESEEIEETSVCLRVQRVWLEDPLMT